jgi:MAE_28990/MAE_18760-like HEPN
MRNWSVILEEDLRWREAELASLKRMAINNSDNADTLRTTLRAAWAILYAHFEGFTKFCWELLLDQIESRDITNEELTEEFLVLALERRFRQLRGDLSSSSLWRFFHTEVPSALRERAAFAVDCRLDTKSNLWPNVFERECARIGISSTAMQSHRPRMTALVSRRNEIAHGKNMTIKSINEFTQYENSTLLVLHDLAVQVLDILERDTYKKP